MVSAAIASRSAVDTPGATAARIRSSAACTTNPAARILTSCSGVFSCTPTLPTVRAERVDRPHRDVFHQARGVDADELALAAVELDQRGGLLGVLHEALGDRLG